MWSTGETSQGTAPTEDLVCEISPLEIKERVLIFRGGDMVYDQKTRQEYIYVNKKKEMADWQYCWHLSQEQSKHDLFPKLKSS